MLEQQYIINKIMTEASLNLLGRKDQNHYIRTTKGKIKRMKNPKPEEAHNRSLQPCAFLLLALYCLKISFHVLPLKSAILAQQDQPGNILSIFYMSNLQPVSLKQSDLHLFSKMRNKITSTAMYLVEMPEQKVLCNPAYSSPTIYQFISKQ